jgi:integrase
VSVVDGDGVSDAHLRQPSSGNTHPKKPWKAHAALRRLVKGTEFEGIGFHTLRHSFSSNLAEDGVDDRMIDYFMGHRAEEMRRRYQHLFPRGRRDAIDRLDDEGSL